MSWELVAGAFLLYLVLRLIFARKERPNFEIQRRPEPSKRIKIEIINGIVYLWDYNNKDFLAQGKTLDDAISVLKIRFPDGKFVMDETEYDKTTV